jgi:hypothetical protein
MIRIFFFWVMSGLLVIKRCLWNPGTKCGGFQPTMFDYQMVQDVWPKTKILGPNSKSNPMACSIYSFFSVYGIVSINPQVKACQWSQSRQRQISVARLAWYSLSWRWTIPDAYPFKDSLRQFYHERSRFLVTWTETTESLKEETKTETCAPEIGFVPLSPSSPSSINHLADFDTTWTKNRSLAYRFSWHTHTYIYYILYILQYTTIYSKRLSNIHPGLTKISSTISPTRHLKGSPFWRFQKKGYGAKARQTGVRTS